MEPVSIVVSVVISILVALAFGWLVFKAVKNSRHATRESGYHGGPTAPGVMNLGHGLTLNQDPSGSPKSGRRDKHSM